LVELKSLQDKGFIFGTELLGREVGLISLHEGFALGGVYQVVVGVKIGGVEGKECFERLDSSLRVTNSKLQFTTNLVEFDVVKDHLFVHLDSLEGLCVFALGC
jgi:hypothetical protein